MTKLLVIEHEDNAGPGWFGQWWREAGAEVDVVAPYTGAAVPASAAGYDALVVLGGSMGATADDSAPWLPATRDLIARTVRNDEAAFLGICLGHQLATVALGGEIGPNHALTLGPTVVGLTDAGCDDPLLGPTAPSSRAIQYNYDHVVRVPAGAVVLASAPDEHIQALRYGPRAWGVQFHPECGPELFDEWTLAKPVDAAEREALATFDLDAISRDVHASRDELQAAWRPLALRLLTLTQQED